MKIKKQTKITPFFRFLFFQGLVSSISFIYFLTVGFTADGGAEVNSLGSV